MISPRFPESAAGRAQLINGEVNHTDHLGVLQKYTEEDNAERESRTRGESSLLMSVFGDGLGAVFARHLKSTRAANVMNRFDSLHGIRRRSSLWTPSR